MQKYYCNFLKNLSVSSSHASIQAGWGVNMYTTWSCHWTPHNAQDVLFTYRFSEAVCSGGIPVMVTSSQVPPLQDLVPFDTYGVLIRDEEIPGARDELGVGIR